MPGIAIGYRSVDLKAVVGVIVILVKYPYGRLGEGELLILDGLVLAPGYFGLRRSSGPGFYAEMVLGGAGQLRFACSGLQDTLGQLDTGRHFGAVHIIEGSALIAVNIVEQTAGLAELTAGKALVFQVQQDAVALPTGSNSQLCVTGRACSTDLLVFCFGNKGLVIK